MLDIFRRMVNDAVRIGMQYNVSTMKRLSSLSYKHLSHYDILSYYKQCAIARAAGILANRKKSIKRGYKTKDPYVKALFLVCYRGFKIVDNKTLKIPLGNGKYFDISLTKYTQSILSDEALVIHSVLLTDKYASITISHEAAEFDPMNAAGIDRNLRNLTYGNHKQIIQFDLTKTIEIAETTKDIVKSFKRNDVRIRRKIASKYGTRRKNRINQILHRVSKAIVYHAAMNKQAIVFEDIRHINNLHRRGNYSSRYKRRLMNNDWSFSEQKRQIEYEARWLGVPVINLTKGETRGTSVYCPKCGKRTQLSKHRKLWCIQCQIFMDRDVVAAMNIAHKGLLRFGSSKGIADEAMKWNLERDPIVLLVDAVKVSRALHLMTPKNL